MESIDKDDSLSLQGQVLQLSTDREFDALEIDKIFERIWILTENSNQWAFYQKIGVNFGISTSGVDALYQNYFKLESRGCCVIVVESDNLFVDIALHRRPPTLKLPVIMSKDANQLNEVIKQYLGNH